MNCSSERSVASDDHLGPDEPLGSQQELAPLSYFEGGILCRNTEVGPRTLPISPFRVGR